MNRAVDDMKLDTHTTHRSHVVVGSSHWALSAHFIQTRWSVAGEMIPLFQAKRRSRKCRRTNKAYCSFVNVDGEMDRYLGRWTPRLL